MSGQKQQGVPHPYFPRGVSIPHYVPNDRPLLEILGLFFSLVGVVLFVTWVYSTRRRLGVTDRLIVCWFVVCGGIHSILEGYFSLYHDTLAGSSSYLAQMWKEYGKGDSRYITSDTFTVCMETITAVIDGPLSLLTAHAILNHAPHRYFLQLTVSLCQLYGDSLYYMTEIREGFKHGELWHPLHFWFYFVFLNAFWIIIPLTLIGQAGKRISQSQSLYDKDRRTNSKKKSK
ncbi:hypothetical protein FSP39_020519 [Pinctada imbricata]|uniref:EXPERA domain-containing protein n=1 Tax=Pinctada imbricata TaxID=66713 RepID=A0AA88YS18_PINIB|nr:hypothetical protein FSP39_020519 [Pinctada imbricata]